MDNLKNNPYLDRPVQKRYRSDSLLPKSKPPEVRKVKRKPSPVHQQSEETFYKTARERKEAEALKNNQ